jgi:pyruvate formate lyase activating enzyme
MIIAGVSPCSFIDCPGCLSAVLFVQGCNLRCCYCHNPSLVGEAPEQRFDQRQVLSFLSGRRGQLGAVVISGGEPTLSPGLRALVLKVRDFGFRVKLDTNGTGPGVLDALLQESLLDFVAMDLKDLPEAYAELCGTAVAPETLRRSIRTILAARVQHEFRTTVVAPHHDAERLLGMAPLLEGAQSWVLQQYRPGRTLMPDPPFRSPDLGFLQAMASRIQNEAGLPCSCRGAPQHRPLTRPDCNRPSALHI